MLEEFPNGGVRFTCKADDTGMPPRTTIATVDTLLDLGPAVRILAPKDDSVHALRSPVVVEFEVLPSPVAENDDGAAISSIDFRVLDQEFEYEELDESGRYTVSIPFNDTTIFQMPPSNADISVTAYNSRRPNAVEKRAEVNVKLDSAGPSITIMSPARQQIVRGQIQLVVKITDTSGVDNTSVIGRINTDKSILDEWEINGDTYVAQFDTRLAIFEDLPDITIDVTARDMVGNERTVDHLLRLDNVPPLVSLDPPPIREWYIEGDITRCSQWFDPVGPDATNDLDDRPEAAMFRAIVEDQTNSIRGGNAQYFAGVNKSSVRLYARHDDGIPLLIDTDDDGRCDDINSSALSEDDRPAVQTLTAMEVRGTAPYVTGTTFEDPVHTAGSACRSGTATEFPDTFCGTGMTRVVHQDMEGKPEAIYSLLPRGGMDSAACNGATWSLEPNVGEGWTCLAASVLDNIGNRGVSRPIRVCLDDGSDPAPSCLEDKVANPPPTCTDGCSLPDDFPMHRMLYRR